MKSTQRSVGRALVGLVLAAGGACGGGRGGQSQECRDYIACYARVGGTGSLEQTYAAGGSCWSGGAALADSCTAACRSTLATLKASYPGAGC